MSLWGKGTIFTRYYPGHGYIEIRNDVAKGWEWMLRRNDGASVAYHLVNSLDVAKRQAAAEAKKRGWK